MKRVQKFLQTDEVQPNIRIHPKMDHTALSIKGSFSWGFTEKKDADDLKKDKEKEKQEKKDKKEKKVTVQEEEVEKPLKDYLHLQNLDIQINKGEFVCVIGDVGSGKSSLFAATIGDMIYVPEQQIKDFGGITRLAKKAEF